MNDDAFGSALDEADNEPTGVEESTDDEQRTMEFIEKANEGGVRDATVGFGVSQEMHYIYRELSDSDDVDVDLRQQFRDQIERVAQRFPEVADKARRKYEIDHE